MTFFRLKLHSNNAGSKGRKGEVKSLKYFFENVSRYIYFSSSLFSFDLNSKIKFMNRTKYILTFLSIIFVIIILLNSYSHQTDFVVPARNYTNDDYVKCLINLNEVFRNLSLPWFITFGTALAYWRSKDLISHDIDIGLFSQDLIEKKMTSQQFISVMIRQSHFIFRRNFGQIDHGQEWSFLCPESYLTIDIFVFYPLNQAYYWSATYTGLCDKMRFRKCRWKYRQFQLEQIQLQNKQISIVPLTFIKERYGNDYMVKKFYDYHDSLKILPNLIQES